MGLIPDVAFEPSLQGATALPIKETYWRLAVLMLRARTTLGTYMGRFQIGSGFPYDAISDFPMMRFQISL